VFFFCSQAPRSPGDPPGPPYRAPLPFFSPRCSKEEGWETALAEFPDVLPPALFFADNLTAFRKIPGQHNIQEGSLMLFPPGGAAPPSPPAAQIHTLRWPPYFCFFLRRFVSPCARRKPEKPLHTLFFFFPFPFFSFLFFFFFFFFFFFLFFFFCSPVVYFNFFPTKTPTQKIPESASLIFPPFPGVQDYPLFFLLFFSFFIHSWNLSLFFFFFFPFEIVFNFFPFCGFFFKKSFPFFFPVFAPPPILWKVPLFFFGFYKCILQYHGGGGTDLRMTLRKPQVAPVCKRGKLSITPFYLFPPTPHVFWRCEPNVFGVHQFPGPLWRGCSPLSPPPLLFFSVRELACGFPSYDPPRPHTKVRGPKHDGIRSLVDAPCSGRRGNPGIVFMWGVGFFLLGGPGAVNHDKTQSSAPDFLPAGTGQVV